jgi:hypothetical protein
MDSMNPTPPTEQREAKIVADVHELNNTIKALACDLTHTARRSELAFREIFPNASRRGHGLRVSTFATGDIIVALPSILGRFHVSDETTDIVVKASIYNTLVSLVHVHFFEGTHFFGVGCEALRDDLEAMYHRLVENSKSKGCSKRKGHDKDLSLPRQRDQIMLWFSAGDG